MGKTLYSRENKQLQIKSKLNIVTLSPVSVKFNMAASTHEQDKMMEESAAKIDVSLIFDYTAMFIWAPTSISSTQ